MNSTRRELTWQAIAHHDPYLAGSIAARSWNWWDEDITAESEAASVGLVETERAIFLRGWNEEVQEQEKERKELLVKEYDEMADGYLKGDPAAR